MLKGGVGEILLKGWGGVGRRIRGRVLGGDEGSSEWEGTEMIVGKRLHVAQCAVTSIPRSPSKFAVPDLGDLDIDGLGQAREIMIASLDAASGNLDLVASLLFQVPISSLSLSEGHGPGLTPFLARDDYGWSI